MDSMVISALIGAGSSLVVSLIAFLSSQRKADREQDERIDKLRFDITSQISDVKTSIRILETNQVELTREVREHNNFAKRMPVVEEQIKVANNRIADLERANERRELL